LQPGVNNFQFYLITNTLSPALPKHILLHLKKFFDLFSFRCRYLCFSSTASTIPDRRFIQGSHTALLVKNTNSGENRRFILSSHTALLVKNTNSGGIFKK
jgi:hypothetical protein